MLVFDVFPGMVRVNKHSKSDKQKKTLLIGKLIKGRIFLEKKHVFFSRIKGHVFSTINLYYTWKIRGRGEKRYKIGVSRKTDFFIVFEKN